MNKLIKIVLPLVIASTFVQSQSLQGNIDVNAIIVHYTYVAREAHMYSELYICGSRG